LLSIIVRKIVLIVPLCEVLEVANPTPLAEHNNPVQSLNQDLNGIFQSARCGGCLFDMLPAKRIEQYISPPLILLLRGEIKVFTLQNLGVWPL